LSTVARSKSKCTG